MACKLLIKHKCILQEFNVLFKPQHRFFLYILNVQLLPLVASPTYCNNSKDTLATIKIQGCYRSLLCDLFSPPRPIHSHTSCIKCIRRQELEMFVKYVAKLFAISTRKSPSWSNWQFVFAGVTCVCSVPVWCTRCRSSGRAVRRGARVQASSSVLVSGVSMARCGGEKVGHSSCIYCILWTFMCL